MVHLASPPEALCLTGKHREDGCKCVELEPVDDIAGMEELETHEAEANHQQQDIEHLGDH